MNVDVNIGFLKWMFNQITEPVAFQINLIIDSEAPFTSVCDNIIAIISSGFSEKAFIGYNSTLHPDLYSPVWFSDTLVGWRFCLVVH